MTGNAGLYRRFVDEVVVGKNIDVLDDLFHPDAVLPAQGSLEGLRAQMVSQAEGLNARVEYLHQFTDGDWVISHMAIEATHVGSFLGRPGSGKTARFEEIECARIVDGRIAEMWAVADIASALVQFGLPLPGTE